MTQNPETIGPLPRAWRFLRKPLHEKTRLFSLRWARVFPQIPVPVLLPFGAWWLIRNDNAGHPIQQGKFERAEMSFVQRFVQSGMTVLDVGAHHGFYTLLASRLVGSRGRVFAFEPSARERRALRLHLILNGRTNVIVQSLALGNQNGEATLFLVEKSASGLNSLRPPRTEVEVETSCVPVRVARLDEWLNREKIDCVDFMKLDVEGAELDVLRGASRLLERRPRPVILIEVQDIRAAAWGYRGKDLVNHLTKHGYGWFGLTSDGHVQELDLSTNDFEGNFVACPEESITKLDRLRSKPAGVEPCASRGNG